MAISEYSSLSRIHYFSFWRVFQTLGNYNFRALLFAYC